MDQRTPHHPPPDVLPRKRSAQRIGSQGRACIGCSDMVVRRRPRQCTAGTNKPMVESSTSRSDDRRGGLRHIGGRAVAAELYVVNDATTRKCTVVDTRPATTGVAIVDNGAFKTRTEAETGMKTTRVCISNEVVTRERAGCGCRRPPAFPQP